MGASTASLITAMSAVQGTTQLAGGLLEAQAIRDQSRYASEVERANARLAEIQAGQVERAGDKASQERLVMGRQLQGSQRAAAAGQGVRVSSGTPQDLQTEAAAAASQDAEAIRLDAFRQAWGLRVEASQRRFRAKSIRSAGRFAATQTAITGGLGFANSLALGQIQAAEFSDTTGLSESSVPSNFSTFRFRRPS